MNFDEIYEQFRSHRKDLKVVSIASTDAQGEPNCAPKMLVDITLSKKIYYIEYKFTKTYTNLIDNHRLSLCFMDDDSFTAYRLTGDGQVVSDDQEIEQLKKAWDKRLAAYETDRMLKRMAGEYSTREAEIMLPHDFVLVCFVPDSAAVVKPDRVLRAEFQ